MFPGFNDPAPAHARPTGIALRPPGDQREVAAGKRHIGGDAGLSPIISGARPRHVRFRTVRLRDGDDAWVHVSELAAPDTFADLSLSVVKLMGPGEYALELPGQPYDGHFGLAVKDYAHSTAPNRRFPDLLIQRLLKAALAGSKPPYSGDELAVLAQHCTEQEEAAKKVERQIVKSAGAILLAPRVGEKFDATVTGVTDGGTWVRIFHPPVEGKLEKGFEGLKVGDRLRVQLVHTDVERGYIDFVKAA